MTQDQELDALYAMLPALDCQGHCWTSCGPIAMSAREHNRIAERTGQPVTCSEDLVCSLLKDHRCSVYDIRPMLCRLWGLVESMPCTYGCRPDGGLLSDLDGFRLLAEARRIGNAE